MLKFIIPAVSVAALAASSVPAFAQTWGENLDGRKANIARRIEMGETTGALTTPEAIRLRAQFRQVLRLEATYRRGGLSPWEHTDLQRRLDRLSAAIRFERRDRDYSYGDGYGRYRY
jgi:hypothetical protein